MIGVRSITNIGLSRITNFTPASLSYITMRKNAGRYTSRIRRLWYRTFFLLFILSALIWSFIIFTMAVDRTATTPNDTEANKDIFTPVSKPLSLQEINEMKHKVATINREERIYNENKFPQLGNDSLVILVQVHNRIHHLRYLIGSLKVAKGISKAFLIFSHDYYDDDINDLIREIDFCKVMQIFYPYSIQIYPNEFPGKDPQDCSADTSQEEAIKRSCKNAIYPDNRGKYRSPSSVQVKHHWWWKANAVFNLGATRYYDGLVLFLEEDLFLIDDFIPTLKLMESAARNYCDYCKILSLAGNGEAINLDRADFDKADKAMVISQFSNMGFAFNRSTWAEMVDCRDDFCVFDDYNWDFSLQHVFTMCMGKTAAMILAAPRVFHMGTCGMHFESKDCDPSEVVAAVHRIITAAADNNHLHPSNLILSFQIDHSKWATAYGGWGDPRDHAFCLGMTIR